LKIVTATGNDLSFEGAMNERESSMRRRYCLGKAAAEKYN
jgi:hypothetical protein